MLQFKEFVPRAPDRGFIRVEHGFGCQGTSQALRIERKSDGGIKAYCFRCNESGSYSSKKTRLANLKKQFGTQVITRTEDKVFKMPAKLISDPKDFSLEALQWLNKYKITATEIHEHSILFNPSINRLVLPVYKDGELVLFMYRQLVEDGYPKYIVYQRDHKDSCGKLIDTGTNNVVIVEDMLSAIKCSRVTGYSSYAMLGSHIGPVDKINLITQFDNFIIYLDNDSRQIKIKQGVLKNFFSMFNKPAYLIKVDKDPKDFNQKELENMFQEAMNVI